MRVQSSSKPRISVARNPIVFLLLLCLLPGAAVAPPTPDPAWIWPVDGSRAVITPFRAPAHDYGPGHRGIDLAAPMGTVVRAPAAGIVAFRGVVVDRPLVTIDHGGGLVTTLEPVESTLTPGTAVAAGEEIGTVSHGGHTPADQLHLGVRYHDVYINPMVMFGDVPRAILLPCCAQSSAATASGTSGTDMPSALTRGGGRVGRSL